MVERCLIVLSRDPLIVLSHVVCFQHDIIKMYCIVNFAYCNFHSKITILSAVFLIDVK